MKEKVWFNWAVFFGNHSNIYFSPSETPCIFKKAHLESIYVPLPNRIYFPWSWCIFWPFCLVLKTDILSKDEIRQENRHWNANAQPGVVISERTKPNATIESAPTTKVHMIGGLLSLLSFPVLNSWLINATSCWPVNQDEYRSLTLARSTPLSEHLYDK